MAADTDLKTAVARVSKAASDDIKAISAKLSAKSDSVTSADVEDAVASLNGISATLEAETAALTAGDTPVVDAGATA